MILKLTNLTKSFAQDNKNKIDVLKDINFEIKDNQTVAILGQSGSGKSTFLSLISGLDGPSSGEVWINNKNLGNLNENELSRFRAKNIGIIFQQFHLMTHLTALENVSLPLELARDKNAIEKSKEVLELVGLTSRLSHFPSQLSGGECQRVAIARALVVKPAILLADEPTGNLDEKTGDKLTTMLFDLIKKNNMTMLLVTHNTKMADHCSHKYYLNNGCLNDSMD